MEALRRRGISSRFGLAVLVAWPALVIGLSAIGERVALIYIVALLGVLPALLGAVTWLRAGQTHWRVVLQKRLVAITCFAIVASVPLTHWPLQLSLLAARPALKRLASRVVPPMIEATIPTRGWIPVQVDLNPPVRCGLLKVETLEFAWDPICSCEGCAYTGKIQFWVNRDGRGPAFFGEWNDPEGINPEIEQYDYLMPEKEAWKDERSSTEKRRAWKKAPEISSEFTADTPTPLLMRQR